MSTSILYHGFGVYGYHYVKTEYRNGDIYFYIRHNPEKIRCSNCHSYNYILRGTKRRIFRTLSIGNRKVFLVLDIQKVGCKKCGLMRQVELGIADSKKTYTKSFERYILNLCDYMTIQDVAKHLNITWDTVKQILKQNLQKEFGNPSLKDLKRFAIDEIAVKKGHKYLTVVLDLETGVVVFVGEGKGKDALKPFWENLKKIKSEYRSSSDRYVPSLYCLSESEYTKCSISI